MASIIAHRGASRAEQENTVAAFVQAVVLGAEGIELDVRLTQDGIAVVHHDPQCTDRYGNEALICDLEVGDLPDFLPTLAQALDACAGAFVNIEIKNSPQEADFDPERKICSVVLAELAGREISNWVVSSFDRGSIDRMRELAPEVVTAWLAVEFDANDLHELVEAGHKGLHPWEQLLTADLVAAAHDSGLFVNAWTCNDPDRIRELAAWGVDGIVTDVPDLARLALQTL
jgi:glycerophosphoryl diester phosphodiesterase